MPFCPNSLELSKNNAQHGLLPMNTMIRSKAYYVLFLSLLYCCFPSPTVMAVTLDTSFGDNGLVTTALNHYGDSAKAVIIDKNNKILVAGISNNGADSDFSLARYNEDGTLDKTFNHDGIVTTQVGNSNDIASAVGLQKDGKIIVAGSISNGDDTDIGIVRYHPDGSLDQDFGLGGIVLIQIGNGDDDANAISILDDDSIVIAGSVSSTSGKVAVLARIHYDGSTDSTFGHDGVVYSSTGRDTTATGMQIDSNNAIVVTGYSKDKNGSDLLLMRFLANGQPDLTFGLGGMVDTADIYRTETSGNAIILQENGAILIAGSSGRDNAGDIALFRFLANGQYDPSFGSKGLLSTDINGEEDGAYDITATPDGITIGGYTTINGLRDFVLLYYPYNDSPQQGDGIIIGTPVVEQNYNNSETFRRVESQNNPMASVTTTSVSSFDDTGYGMAVQNDFKIVLVGNSGDEGMNNYGIARYVAADTSADFTKSADTTIGITSPCIITNPAIDITRVSGLAGGTILDKESVTNNDNCHSSVDERGIVYSILPYPVWGNGGTEAPVLSGLSPQGVASATSVTLSVTTDVSATCKYTDTSSGMDYNNMSGDFDTTGTTKHSEPQSNLEDGKTYTYWVRCKNNSSGAVNSTDGVIKFTVNLGGGSGGSEAPVLSGLSPQGVASATPVTLSVTTDVSATCKYTDTSSGMDYNDMSGDFDTTGTTKHSELQSNLEDGKTYTYWVRCKNESSGKVNSTDGVIEFTVDLGPTRSNGQPTGVLEKGSTETTLSVNTDVTAECRYKETAAGLTFATMTQFSNTNADLHQELITGLTDGDHYNYSVRCQDTSGNTNTTNYNIPFSVETSSARVSRAYFGTQQTQSTTGPIKSSDNQVVIPGAEEQSTEGTVACGSGPGSFETLLENLEIGTRYYVRAYTKSSGGDIYYGNQVTFETKDACFIATAAYGSVLHPYVASLRTFRDSYLLTSSWGRSLIKGYYHYSPAIADVIAQHQAAKSFVRMLLLPLIAFSYIAVKGNIILAGTALILAIITGGLFLLFLKRRRQNHIAF